MSQKTIEDTYTEVCKLRSQVADLARKIDALSAANPAAPAAPAGVVQPADARELTSQYGDPEVRKDPARWIKQGGESYVGRKFSQCPPAYLREIADLFIWMANKRKEEGEPQKKIDYALKDAARALGWAREAEAALLGQKSLVEATSGEEPQDDLPF